MPDKCRFAEEVELFSLVCHHPDIDEVSERHKCVEIKNSNRCPIMRLLQKPAKTFLRETEKVYNNIPEPSEPSDWEYRPDPNVEAIRRHFDTLYKPKE